MIQNKRISDMDNSEFDIFLFTAISKIDELTAFEYCLERNIPLPTFDDIDDTEHEFFPEFHEKMAQLFKEVCGEDYVYQYPIKATLTDSADSVSTALCV